MQLNIYTNTCTRVMIELHNGDSSESSKTKNVDEIVNYLEARYVSATEYCFRLFAF